MLFSATVPKWVQKLCRQYLNDPVNVDMVGEGQTGKMADSITALAVQVGAGHRGRVLGGLEARRVQHGATGRAGGWPAPTAGLAGSLPTLHRLTATPSPPGH